jgi:hypothetical protein
LTLPRCIFTVAERKQSKVVISFEEWNWKSCSAALEFRKPCERFFSFLSHVHLQPFSFISSQGDRFTKVIVNRKSKITLKISLRARIRAFH